MNGRRSKWNEVLERRSALNSANRLPMPDAPRLHKECSARAEGPSLFREPRAAPDKPAEIQVGAANRSPPSIFLVGAFIV